MEITPPLTIYRRLGALIFEEAVRATGLPPGALGLRLRDELNRPTLTAPTLRAWRRGSKAVPLAAFLAVCRIANVQPAEFVSRIAGTGTSVEKDLADLLQLLGAGRTIAQMESVRAASSTR